MKEKKNRGVEVGFHCFFCAYFSSAQFFSFPGRAMDTAVPTGWMTLGTLEVKHHFFVKNLGKTKKILQIYLPHEKSIPEHSLRDNHA